MYKFFISVRNKIMFVSATKQTKKKGGNWQIKWLDKKMFLLTNTLPLASKICSIVEFMVA